MKLNFWQWLGILCLIGGAIGYVWLKDKGKKPAPTPPPPAATAPAAPATAP